MAAGQRVNPQALAIKGFSDRVQQYISLQKKVESSLPKQSTTNDPAQIDVHRKALAQAIRVARQDAKPGDVFGDAGQQIREIMRRDAHDRTIRDAFAAMEEVPKQTRPAVNAEYPEKASLATVPPLILARLPRLPAGIEYRFMGRDLILRDANSNLIVDLLRDAVPTILK